MRRNLMCRVFGAVLVVSFLVAAAAADVKLPGVFGDHMVLQREMPVPVWGWADPAEQVTVTLGDQSKTATADSAGKWSVKLDALKAGGPFELKVQGKASAVQLSDVLVGEVWLCSGQSNMEMTVGGVMNKDAEIAAADHPKIRMLGVAKKTAKEPQDNSGGQWRLCSPKTVAGFSAAGYFFGRELHKQLDVPVGLINSSWGGTPIEAWTSAAAHEAVPELRSRIEEFEAAGRVVQRREGQGSGTRSSSPSGRRPLPRQRPNEGSQPPAGRNPRRTPGNRPAARPRSTTA